MRLYVIEVRSPVSSVGFELLILLTSLQNVLLELLDLRIAPPCLVCVILRTKIALFLGGRTRVLKCAPQ